jgi:glycosyltransferase involved in cell wall biosynthesis
MKNTLMSVIVPIYGPERYLDNLTNWFLSEDFENVEIILIHDLRPNESGIILQELKERFQGICIKITSGEFGSPGLARNKGLELSRSEWITFCDADDLQHTSTIVKSLSLFPDSDMIFGQFNRRYLKSTEVIQNSTKNISDIWLDPGFWRGAYKREYISKIRFSSLRMGEDVVFLSEALQLNGKVAFSESIFYEYRVGVDLQSISRENNYVDISRAIRLILNRNPKWANDLNDLGFLTRLAVSNLKYSIKKRKNYECLVAIKILFFYSLARTRVPLYSFMRRRNS